VLTHFAPAENADAVLETELSSLIGLLLLLSGWFRR
jgi:hypothetical protein